MFPHIFFATPMPTLDPLTSFIRDEVQGLGFELVDLRVTGPRHRLAVRARIDRPDSRPGAGVTSGDCTRVARELRARVSTLPGDPVETLEVSSPGLERPLRWPAHWRRFVGAEVRVRTPAVPGRPTAIIVAVPDDGHVILRFPDAGERTIALDDIADATLVVDWSTTR